MTQTIENGVFHSKAGFVSGTPIFVGTRVPLKNLFDYLAGGHSLDDFLDDFPSVSREQAVRTIDIAVLNGSKTWNVDPHGLFCL